MKIHFYRDIGMPFDGDDYYRGTGGLELQAISLGRELAKRGHVVTFYVHCARPSVYDRVSYYDVSSYAPGADVLIGISVVPPESNAVRVSWTHDSTHGCYSPNLDFIVCNSKWTLEHYQKKHPGGNYTVISNGFPYDDFATPRLPKKENSIVLAGSPLKGFREIPEVFKKIKAAIPSAAFNVYGGAKLWGWLEKDYQKLYSAMDEASINYHGRVPREELVRAYQESEVYFSPRCDYLETFGLAVVESMAAGCVPVCTRAGNQTNLITENSGILLENRTSVDEARAIIDLLKDRTKLRKLSEGARQETRKYDWPNVISQWEEKIFR